MFSKTAHTHTTDIDSSENEHQHWQLASLIHLNESLTVLSVTFLWRKEKQKKEEKMQ